MGVKWRFNPGHIASYSGEESPYSAIHLLKQGLQGRQETNGNITFAIFRSPKRGGVNQLKNACHTRDPKWGEYITPAMHIKQRGDKRCPDQV